jgi:hypothetical protein
MARRRRPLRSPAENFDGDAPHVPDVARLEHIPTTTRGDEPVEFQLAVDDGSDLELVENHGRSARPSGGRRTRRTILFRDARRRRSSGKIAGRGVFGGARLDRSWAAPWIVPDRRAQCRHKAVLRPLWSRGRPRGRRAPARRLTTDHRSATAVASRYATARMYRLERSPVFDASAIRASAHAMHSGAPCSLRRSFVETWRNK